MIFIFALETKTTKYLSFEYQSHKRVNKRRTFLFDESKIGKLSI